MNIILREYVFKGLYSRPIYFFGVFFLVLGEVDWNTLEADIRFSMYWPNTWFSDFSLRFSSLTESTLWDKSEAKLFDNRV